MITTSQLDADDPAATSLDPDVAFSAATDDGGEEEDVFAGITDEPAPTAAGQLDHYLTRALRGYGELHRDWIQKPRTHKGPRGSLLADFVTNRRENALEAMLLLHCLEPVLRNGEPLSMGVWANLLSAGTGHHVGPNAASKAFGVLAEMKLAHPERKGPNTLVEPLAEDGSGTGWQRPGLRKTVGQGYFTLPFAYWTAGHAARLKMPGKAMLLILLADTQPSSRRTTQIPIERASEWYGISERTAERGYRELTEEGLLLTKFQQVANPKLAAGRHTVYHRALKSPFSTQSRERLQKVAREAGSRRRGTADTSSEGGD